MKKIMEMLQNMKAKNEKKDNKGFSLVELIIVIAIMAILVGVVGTQVIPYIDKARNAKDIQKLSGLCTDATTAYSSNAANLDSASTYVITINDSVAVTGGTGAENAKLVAAFKEVNDVANVAGLGLESKAGKAVDSITITCKNSAPMIQVVTVIKDADKTKVKNFDPITSK